MTSTDLLQTLLNLHEGIANGGKGIQESDWQAVRNHLKNNQRDYKIRDFSYQEISTILAALRNFQDQISEQGIASVSHMPHFEDVEPLNPEQIDLICEGFYE